jgi:TolB-like protein/Flp pilus assembly protein TadD
MSLIVELKRRNVLRVAAAYVAVSWLLIQVAETTFPAFGLGGDAIRAVIIVLVVGLVPMLIFAWVFELTSDGIRREADADHGSVSSKKMTRRLDRLIMVFLALALGYFAVDKFVLDPERDQAREKAVAEQARSEALIESYGEKSIAVLAFQDLSAEGDQEYFSDGISEELLNLLARIPELRVAGKTSAFSFKDKDATIAQIGEALNVGHVLEGSVRKFGDRLRITAQLIDARSDTHVWSQTYDRNFGDIFAIQDEIAAEVVGLLKVTLLGSMPKVQQTDPAAYALYLQASQVMNRMSKQSPANALSLVEEALSIDPGYAPAWILLARALNYHAVWGLRSADEIRGPAQEALRKALALDPDNAQAVTMLGLMDPRADTGWQFTADVLAQGFELDPNNLVVLRWVAVHNRDLGRLDQSIAISKRLLERDPLCTQCLYSLTKTYIFADRLDEAETTIRRYQALNEGGGHTLGIILLLRGEPEAALAEFDQLEGQIAPLVLHGRALALHDLGRQEAFEVVFKELREDHAEPLAGMVYRNLGMIAEVYAWTGDNDGAFEWLERSVEKTGYPPPHFNLSPMYSNLHPDPRWHLLLERTGVAPEQLAAVKFDLDIPD